MPADLRLSGAKELEAALRELGNEVAGRLGENAVRAGAREVAKAARTTSKFVDRSGTLRKSIRAFSERQRLKGERTAYAGTRVFYGRLLEFGTQFIPARSWLRKALDESGQQAVDKMVDNLRSGINRVAAKHRTRR